MKGFIFLKMRSYKGLIFIPQKSVGTLLIHDIIYFNTFDLQGKSVKRRARSTSLAVGLDRREPNQRRRSHRTKQPRDKKRLGRSGPQGVERARETRGGATWRGAWSLTTGTTRTKTASLTSTQVG